jgi:type I restriction enzyme S subunit
MQHCDALEQSILQSKTQNEQLLQVVLKETREGKKKIKQYEFAKPDVKVAAEPVSNYKPVKTIPLHGSTEDEHPRKVLAAFIVSICYEDDHFGKTKFQKTLHLVEYHCKVDYETCYRQKAAGPLDIFIYRFIKEAAEKDWLRVHHKNSFEYFELGTNLHAILSDFRTCFSGLAGELKFLLRLLKDQTTTQSELISTIYAVWNNFLIKGAAFTDEQLIAGVYEWSPEKEKFTELEILAKKKWMIKQGLVPVGCGKEITKQEAM